MTADSDRHAMKMAKKKAARDKIMATKTDEKGLVMINTGKGKGKSSAAFGMIFRCIAHDMKCAVVQFIKGGMSTGERDLILGKFSDTCSFHTMGEGFTWETQDRDRDIEMAQAAWEKAKELIRDESHKMVLLDEINIALRYDYIDVNEVVSFLTAKPVWSGGRLGWDADQCSRVFPALLPCGSWWFWQPERRAPVPMACARR